MRSKNLTVCGLLTVLLVSLCLTTPSNAWTRTVKTPELSWYYFDWYYGGIVFAIECDTPGADIRYTWKAGYGEAPIPTLCSRLYEGPLVATCIGQLKAKGFKCCYNSSGVLTISIR